MVVENTNIENKVPNPPGIGDEIIIEQWEKDLM
jgi:hypothetical protein